MVPDALRDEARAAVATDGLTPAAVAYLTRDALGTIDFAALAPVKKLLKLFFSNEPWAASDDDALAALVGPGNGWWRYDLDDDIQLAFGWRDGAFRLEVAPATIGATFDGPVVPEATPNPRTIRFVTPSIHDGPSRWYESAAGVDDPRVARIFAESDDVANVLVGPDFVAVGLHRPDSWEQLLGPLLRTVAGEFAAGDAEVPAAVEMVGEQRHTSARSAASPQGGRALERAWKELGSLRAGEPADLDRIVASVSSNESAVRQVAARLLIDAAPEIAEAAWADLLGDESRSVRRATVDAMVDAERPELRPLLERAVGDADPWTRWKALRGLVDLGVAPSRAAFISRADDSDFRVRLEATRALSALER